MTKFLNAAVCNTDVTECLPNAKQILHIIPHFKKGGRAICIHFLQRLFVVAVLKLVFFSISCIFVFISDIFHLTFPFSLLKVMLSKIRQQYKEQMNYSSFVSFPLFHFMLNFKSIKLHPRLISSRTRETRNACKPRIAM